MPLAVLQNTNIYERGVCWRCFVNIFVVLLVLLF